MTCTDCEKAQDTLEVVFPLRVDNSNLVVLGCGPHAARLAQVCVLGLRAEETLNRLREQTEIWAASMKRVIFLNQLAVLLGGSGDSFTGRLLELCAHADPGNLAKLRALYPDVVLAWKAWTSFDTPATPAELWAKISALAEAEL